MIIAFKIFQTREILAVALEHNPVAWASSQGAQHRSVRYQERPGHLPAMTLSTAYSKLEVSMDL